MKKKIDPVELDAIRRGRIAARIATAEQMKAAVEIKRVTEVCAMLDACRIPYEVGSEESILSAAMVMNNERKRLADIFGWTAYGWARVTAVHPNRYSLIDIDWGKKHSILKHGRRDLAVDDLVFRVRAIGHQDEDGFFVGPLPSSSLPKH